MIKNLVFPMLILFGYGCSPKIALNSNIGKPIAYKDKTSPPLQVFNPERKVQDRIAFLSEKTQVFIYTPGTDTTYYGNKGTKIYISGNCLIHEDGSPLTEPASIELIELYSKKDMILTNKPTLSDGKLLESNGEIYLNARVGNNELKISCPYGIEVRLANPFRQNMEMWFGQIDKTGNLNWVKDSLVNEVEPIVANPEMNWDFNEDFGNIKYQVYEENYFEGFLFTTGKFGWINCDRFYEYEAEKTDMYVELKNPLPKEYPTYVYAVFPEINAVLPAYSTDGYKYSFSGLPEGMSVYFVCVSAAENKSFFAIQQTEVIKGGKIMLETEGLSKDAIEKKLEEIN